MTTRKFAPPPTKFGNRRPPQAKSATVAAPATVIHRPPPTRFGTPAPAQPARRAIQPMWMKLPGGDKSDVNPTNQLYLEHQLYLLSTAPSRADALADEIDKIADDVNDNGVIAEKQRILAALDKLQNLMFTGNEILRTSWGTSKESTSSGGDYKSVSSKFSSHLESTLESLKQSDPRQSDLIDKIETKYTNKHHVLIKSIHKDKQTSPGNLLHAGIGNQGSTNTKLHKAMHKLTAACGKVHYSKMDPEVEKLLLNFVGEMEKLPSGLI